MGPLIPLFLNSGDVCPEFQSQDGSLLWINQKLIRLTGPSSQLLVHLSSHQTQSCEFSVQLGHDLNDPQSDLEASKLKK